MGVCSVTGKEKSAATGLPRFAIILYRRGPLVIKSARTVSILCFKNSSPLQQVGNVYCRQRTF